MPAYGKVLSEADVRTLINYLRALEAGFAIGKAWIAALTRHLRNYSVECCDFSKKKTPARN
jgi:hypothetical protein